MHALYIIVYLLYQDYPIYNLKPDILSRRVLPIGQLSLAPQLGCALDVKALNMAHFCSAVMKNKGFTA